MRKIICIIVFSLLIFIPSFNVYFSGDDFYHLKISQISGVSEFASFFSFEKNAFSSSFYRPLTTQVFFFLNQKLFGINSFGYHLIPYLFFALLLLLTYLVSKKLFNNEKIALLSLFFSAFSVSHFAQVYYLSAFQELGMTVFYLFGIFFWIKYLEEEKKGFIYLTLMFFIDSLLSKETAITFPIIIIGITLLKSNKYRLVSTWPLFLIALTYLFFRFAFFGGVAGESYGWEVSLKIINTLGWYIGWSFGLPEMFLDFIGSGLVISPKLWLYYSNETKVILTSFAVILFSAAILFFKKIISKDIKNIVFGIAWFVITLLPVLFLPWHKFPLELTLPFFGFSIILGYLFNNVNRVFLIVAITAFLVLNGASYYLTYKTHWVISRGKVAERAISYLFKNYPNLPNNSKIYFYNDSAYIATNWGASKQVSVALSGSDAIRFFYRKPDIKVYYEDLDGQKEDKDFIRLGTKSFLGY